MPRIIPRLILIITLTLCITSAWAEIMYVTDSFEITVRTGTSTEYKILAMLRSNEEVEVLEDLGDWTKVRLKSGKEGYVLSRYLTPNIPKSFIITGLQKKVKTLQEELRDLREAKDTLEVSNSELEATLRSKLEQLAKLEKDYEDLKSGSAHYIEMKQIKDQLEIDNKELKSQLAAVLEKNRELERKKDSLWFVSGAGVLVAGWVFGLIMGRAQMRRKRRLLYDI
ncbi:TPA: TIGR04211 family SH3 domain-containing protein [Candidatus Micrarchaeota archaeon]|nr:TIGR04211 family SH3 domain-containing protein [Candidatus Micrarchaeota archaeon]